MRKKIETSTLSTGKITRTYCDDRTRDQGEPAKFKHFPHTDHEEMFKSQLMLTNKKKIEKNRDNIWKYKSNRHAPQNREKYFKDLLYKKSLPSFPSPVPIQSSAEEIRQEPIVPSQKKKDATSQKGGKPN